MKTVSKMPLVLIFSFFLVVEISLCSSLAMVFNIFNVGGETFQKI